MKLEDSIGYEGQVRILGISMDIGEAFRLLAKQLGTDIEIVEKKK